MLYLLPSQSKLNMESLTKPELLMLFSILEGELEARDLVIDALKVPFIELVTIEHNISVILCTQSFFSKYTHIELKSAFFHSRKKTMKVSEKLLKPLQ